MGSAGGDSQVVEVLIRTDVLHGVLPRQNVTTLCRGGALDGFKNVLSGEEKSRGKAFFLFFDEMNDTSAAGVPLEIAVLKSS